VGGDAAADAVLAPLYRAGVDLDDVRRVVGGVTRRALVCVDETSGERWVHPERDPQVRLDAAGLARGRIAGARALLVDTEDPEAALAAVTYARSVGVATVLDADSRVPELEALLEQVDFPIVSRSLAEALGGGSAWQGVRVLAEGGPRLAIVTLGDEGCIAVTRGADSVLVSSAFDVAVCDTTGAGDAFHAGFIWALLAGRGMKEMLRVANAVAGLNCKALGAQAGLPTSDRVVEFLAKCARSPEENE
jgi:sugar/nucleoside kinase (ribokinase family)